MRYQPILLHTLYYTLHTEHACCLSYRFLNNVVITTVIEMVEMVEILDGRLGKRSVERVRYVINNLLHLVIVKYGDISLVLCISTRLRNYMCVCRGPKSVGGIAWAKHAHAQSHYWAVKSEQNHCCSALLQNLVRNSEETQCLEEISRGKCRCSLSSSSNC